MLTSISVPNNTATLTPDGDTIPDGALVLPGGAGFYVSVGVPDTTAPGDVVEYRFYDYRTSGTGLNGTTQLVGTSETMASVAMGNIAMYNQIATQAGKVVGTGTVLAPVGAAGGFSGSFALKAGDSKVIGVNRDRRPDPHLAV